MRLFSIRCFRVSSFAILVALLLAGVAVVPAQSKPQKTERPAGEGKKNTRPAPMTEEERKKAEEEKKRLEEEKNAIVDPTVEKVELNIVNVDAVVYNKKSGQIV